MHPSAILFCLLLLCAGCQHFTVDTKNDPAFYWHPTKNSEEARQDLAAARFAIQASPLHHPNGGIIGAVQEHERYSQMLDNYMISKGYYVISRAQAANIKGTYIDRPK